MLLIVTVPHICHFNYTDKYEVIWLWLVIMTWKKLILAIIRRRRVDSSFFFWTLHFRIIIVRRWRLDCATKTRRLWQTSKLFPQVDLIVCKFKFNLKSCQGLGRLQRRFWKPKWGDKFHQYKKQLNIRRIFKRGYISGTAKHMSPPSLITQLNKNLLGINSFYNPSSPVRGSTKLKKKRFKKLKQVFKVKSTLKLCI